MVCVCMYMVCACVQTLRQHLQQENMKKAILGSGIDLQTAVGIIGGGIVPPTTPEIIQEAFKNVSTTCGACACCTADCARYVALVLSHCFAVGSGLIRAT